MTPDDEAGLVLNPTLEVSLELMPIGAAASILLPLAGRRARDLGALLAAATGPLPAVDALRAVAPDRADEIVAARPDLPRWAPTLRISCARIGAGRAFQRIHLDATSAHLLAQLCSWLAAADDDGDIEPDPDLDAAAIAPLLAMGIVQFADEAPTPVRYRGDEPRLAFAPADDEARRLRDELAVGDYAVSRRVAPASSISALATFARDLRAQGYFMRRASPASRAERELIHNEPVLRRLHGELAALVSFAAAEELKPSYSILGYYPPGAALARHVDREQCAWNVSLAVDCDRALPDAALWPLYFELAGAVGEARLAPGDAAIYRGTRTAHWRDPQPAGQSSIFAFFHFVPASFTGSLD